jgi:hypothetical protein
MNAIFLLLTALGHAEPMGPLQTREAIVDRGEVKAGAPLSQKFSLKNEGTGVLAFAKIDAGCGCIRPSISKKMLQPGETAELEVELNTLTQPAGPNAWTIGVRYRDGPETQPTAGVLELRIKAKIVREIDVQPVALHMSIDREATHTITVTDRRSKPLTITAVRCESKHVKTQLTAAGKNGRGENVQQVHVTILETCPPGYFAENLLFVTDDPEYRELRVPLMVTRKSPGQIVCAPEQIDLRLAKGQNAASGLVRLRDPDDKPVVIEKIESDHPDIRTKWAAGPGSMATLRLGIELSDNPSSGLAAVKVHIKEPKPQVIVIPVSWQAPP